MILKEARRAHREVRRTRIWKRRKGIMWDYNGDGRWPEYLDKIMKKYWRKWRRREEKKDLKVRIHEI